MGDVYHESHNCKNWFRLWYWMGVSWIFCALICLALGTSVKNIFERRSSQRLLSALPILCYLQSSFHKKLPPASWNPGKTREGLRKMFWRDRSNSHLCSLTTLFKYLLWFRFWSLRVQVTRGDMAVGNQPSLSFDDVALKGILFFIIGSYLKPVAGF